MPGFDAETVRAELRAYNELELAIEQKREELSILVKTKTLHASNAWRGALLIYKWALLVAGTSSAVARGVSRFEHFMKRGPRRPPAVAATTSSNKSSP